MTIVLNLPSQLILSHAPWITGGFLIVCIIAFAATGLALIFDGQVHGLVAIGVGAGIPLLMFAIIIKRDQAIFDAYAGTVTLQRQTLFGYSRRVHPLADLSEAELQRLDDTSRPVLIFDRGKAAGRHPLVEAFVSGNGPAHAVQTINAWLADLRGIRKSV